VRAAIATRKDFWTGVIYIAVGVCAFLMARHYAFGSAARMGPGYFPTLLSYLLLGLGILTCIVGAVKPGGATERWYLRPVLAVLAALVLFAYGIDGLGLFLTTVLVVILASVATPESRPIEVGIVALALAAFSTALFINALGLPIPAWPRFLVS